jgi:Tol biopolymer transport system component
VGQTAELHVRDLANGVETTLISMPGESQVTGWSPDDRYVVFDSHGSEINSKWETWVADTTGQHNRYPLLQPATDARYTRISPDGKWLAYAGYETGRPEIYVVPVDFSGTQPKAGGNKWQISTEGGAVPVWARDGRELFFTNAPMTTLYAASFTVTDGMVHAGTVRKLFDLSPHSNSSFYDVSPDGKKFYVAEAPQGSSSPLTVITNWLARIKR